MKKYLYYKQEYEKARDRLQNLMELQEAAKMSEEEVKPVLRNVMYYGAYLSGIQVACKKILDDWFKMPKINGLGKKEDRLILEAVLEIVLKSKLDAERWISENIEMKLKPVKFDKKGKPTKYKANWYVERRIRIELE